jgi:ATP-dependent DNA helicase RecG
MYFANYIQQIGSGTMEMIKQCREKGLPEPEFVSIRNLEFRTILARDIFTEDVLSKLGLNERQLKAVKYVKKNGRINNKEYRTVCNTSERTATRDLSQLVTKRLFKVIGSTGKGTEYILRRHKDAKDATKTP